MAISAKLELRQNQQLVMTHQLQQAIRLLQLSNLELSEFVNAELERNPLLERDDSQEAPIAEPAAEPYSMLDSSTRDATEWLDMTKPVMSAGALDTELSDSYPDTPALELGTAPAHVDTWSNVHQKMNNSDHVDHNLEAYVSAETTLKDHLLMQLHLSRLEATERAIARHLIDLVDDTGYITVDLDLVADRLGALRTQLASVLETLQTFDPPGVFARNLAECLALQLKDRNRYDPQIAALLDNLDLLARHELQKLRRILKVDMDELTDMVTELKALSPKPGLKFDSGPVETVVADVFVKAAQDGSWMIELNTDTLPRVLVNRSYYALVSKSARRPEDRSYLQDCLQTANWLTNSLDQRARTILKVSEEIVRQQDAFFTHGIRHLRPLNLRTVADAIKMHESTVSRVTSNKYMSTPRGLFELKFFFTSAISSTEEGESHSSASVRHRIKELIDAEAPSAVLSDDTIVTRLKDEGIDIARRTVAKYREALKIPSSVQRRREKRIQAKVALTP